MVSPARFSLLWANKPVHTLVIICKMRNEIVIIPPSVLTIHHQPSVKHVCLSVTPPSLWHHFRHLLLPSPPGSWTYRHRECAHFTKPFFKKPFPALLQLKGELYRSTLFCYPNGYCSWVLELSVWLSSRALASLCEVLDPTSNTDRKRRNKSSSVLKLQLVPNPINTLSFPMMHAYLHV